MPLLVFAQEGGAAGEAAAGPGPAAAIGWTIALLLIIGFLIALFINSRQARPELGSEIELAANRKPYMDDEELEGRKLDRTLGAGLVLLAFTSISLPLYWLYEPARQEGAVKQFHDIAIDHGAKIYDTKANCAQCHGPEGVGGVAATSLLNESGQFVEQVSWQAPALNTILYRYTRDEVKYILNYGRPSTPMPAWGAPGGGPLTDQQLDNVITYLESIQLPAEEARRALEAEIEKVCAPDPNDALKRCTKTDPAKPDGKPWATLGEALFNLGLYDNFAGGAYSCGRCHTAGWPYGKPAPEAGGGGSSGWAINGAYEHFETTESWAAFVAKGGEAGKKVGNGPVATGMMPGFGINAEAEKDGSQMNADQVMYSPEQIAAIVEYERGL